MPGTYPHESRDRRRIALRSLVLFGLAAVLGLGLRFRTVPSPPPAPPVPQAAPAPAPAEPPPLSYTVRRGDTFAGILTQFGVMERTAAACYRRMRDLGLAALFPGDSLVIRVGDTGDLAHLALRNRREFWYHVSSDSDSVRVERRPVETALLLCSVKGTLTRSLSEDMWEQGEGDGLVAILTEIFAWDINFFTDPRIGDRFEVLFEKRYAEGSSLGYGRVLAAHYRTADGRVYSAFGLPDSTGRMRYYDEGGRSVQKQFLKAPLRYSRISSRYSYSRKHPILGIYRPHLGVDYAAPPGTPVYAAADGVVETAGWNHDYGNQVTIRHGAAYTTCYGHLQTFSSGIAKGVRVTQGQMIGTVGATGLSSGPHLDYRMRISSRHVNPLTVVLPAGDAVSDGQRLAFERARAWCSIMLDMRLADQAGSNVLEIIDAPAAGAQSVSFCRTSPDSIAGRSPHHGGHEVQEG